MGIDFRKHDINNLIDVVLDFHRCRFLHFIELGKERINYLCLPNYC